MDFFDQHLSETKKLMEDKASEILLTNDDYFGSKTMFAPLKGVASNAIISEHLTDLANHRLDQFINLSNSSEYNQRYKTELMSFLKTLAQRKL